VTSEKLEWLNFRAQNKRINPTSEIDNDNKNESLSTRSVFLKILSKINIKDM
jgi:hypothetical protein